MARGGGKKNIFQYCTDSSGEILYLRTLQGHSGHNLIDPSLHIYHIGCAVSVHSIKNSGLIAGGQNSSRERHTVFFLLVDPLDKNHKDPDTIDLNAPRHAQYMHKTWKKHQNTVHWVDINLDLKKGLKRYHSSRNTPSLLYPESC